MNSLCHFISNWKWQSFVYPHVIETKTFTLIDEEKQISSSYSIDFYWNLKQITFLSRILLFFISFCLSNDRFWENALNHRPFYLNRYFIYRFKCHFLWRTAWQSGITAIYMAFAVILLWSVGFLSSVLYCIDFSVLNIKMPMKTIVFKSFVYFIVST